MNCRTFDYRLLFKDFPHTVLSLFFIFYIYHGLIRKYIFDSPYLFMIGDILLILALIFSILSGTISSWRKNLDTRWLFALAYLLLLLLLLSSFRYPLDNFYPYLWGLKAFFLPIVLAFLGYRIARKENIENYIRIFNFYILSPALLLGVIQFFLPPSHLLNQTITSASFDLFVSFGSLEGNGNFVRVSGPFVYTGGFSALVAFAFTNLVCIMYSRIAIKKQDMVFGALVLACLPISGSRTVIFICVLIGLCYLVAELPRLKSISLRNFRIAIFLTITSVFTYYSTDLWTPFQVRLQELAGAGEMDARIAKHFLRTPEIIEKVGFFGYGPGVANNQTLTLIGVSNFIWLDFFPESEPDKFIAEAGGVAYIIFFLFLPLFYFFRILISLNKGIPHSISLYLLFYSLFVLIFGSGMNIMPIFYYFFFFCLGVKAACR